MTTQAVRSQPALPSERPMSADTMKMPEPIIDPTTTIVESNRPRPRVNSVSSVVAAPALAVLFVIKTLQRIRCCGSTLPCLAPAVDPRLRSWSARFYGTDTRERLVAAHWSTRRARVSSSMPSPSRPRCADMHDCSAKMRTSGASWRCFTTSITSAGRASRIIRFAEARSRRETGYPEWVIRAILSHADYSGVARESRLEKTLFACDEMAGFITGCLARAPEQERARSRSPRR